MILPRRVDALVVGCGAAGLSLACHLAAGGWGRHDVLVVDDGAAPVEDRAWAYWSRGDGLLDPFASAGFDRFWIRGPASAHLARLDGYRYRTVTGRQLERAAAGLLAVAPGIRRVRGRVEGLEEHDDGARVAVRLPDGERRSVAATWVFDSVGLDRPGPGAPARDRTRRDGTAAHLAFLGLRIEAEPGSLDAVAPTLMDFRTDQSRGLAFVYVLPESTSVALVELTRFVVGPPAGPSDPVRDRRAVEAYVRDGLGIGAHRVVGAEHGTIPLVSAAPPRPTAHVVPIGVTAGRVRASTGYGYERIQRHSTAITQSLLRHGHPLDVPRPSRRHRALDGLLLDVVRDEPEAAVHAFVRLFAANPAGRVLRFLDEDTGLLEELALVRTLPPGPFLRGLARRLPARRTTSRDVTTRAEERSSVAP